MTLPEPRPPHDRARPGLAAAEDQAPVVIEDNLPPRVRLPANALRCVVQCAEIALLVGLGLLAQATVKGIEQNVVGASQLAERKLLSGLLGLIGDVAHIALLLLPLALAVLLLVHRQPRRLAEAVGTGGIAVAVVTLFNWLLRQQAASQLYGALTLSASHARVPVLDGFLAGLAAYVTVIRLSGRRRWRGAYWTALGFYLLGQPGQSEEHARYSHVVADHPADRLGHRVRLAVRLRLGIGPPDRGGDRRGTERRGRARDGHAQDPGCPDGDAPLRRDRAGWRAAGCHGLRPRPAGRRCALPAVPGGSC